MVGMKPEKYTRTPLRTVNDAVSKLYHKVLRISYEELEELPSMHSKRHCTLGQKKEEVKNKCMQTFAFMCSTQCPHSHAKYHIHSNNFPG